jgi:hypothetical protein
MKVTNATMQTINDKTGKLKGFKFTAMVNESAMVVRELATRPYKYLAIHANIACTKFFGNDPRAFMTFHETCPKAKDVLCIVDIQAV